MTTMEQFLFGNSAIMDFILTHYHGQAIRAGLITTNDFRLGVQAMVKHTTVSSSGRA